MIVFNLDSSLIVPKEEGWNESPKTQTNNVRKREQKNLIIEAFEIKDLRVL